MLQLRPKLKKPVLERKPKSFIFDRFFYLPVSGSPAIVRAVQFPFWDAIPLYLRSQMTFPKSNRGGKEFLLHGINSSLNKYSKAGYPLSNSLKKKTMEALMLKGLNDVVMGYRKKRELLSVRDYWLYKISNYFIAKIVSDHSLQYPRLREFVRRKIYGDSGRFRYLKKMVEHWKEKPFQKDLDVVKFVQKLFKPSLNFLKHSMIKNDLFLSMNMGSEKFNELRLTKFHKTATMLNLIYDVLSTEIDPELRQKLERDQKIINENNNISDKKMISFIVKDYPRFNEIRALRSLCKKHFKFRYYNEKLRNKDRTIRGVSLVKEKRFSEFVRQTLSLFTSGKHQVRREIPQPEEVIPWATKEYNTRRKAIGNKKLVNAHLEFLKDLQNIFSDNAEDLAYRKPLTDILYSKGDEPKISIAKMSTITESEEPQGEEKPSFDDEIEEVEIVGEHVEEPIMITDNGFRWKTVHVQKASYIILRFLKNMSTIEYLPGDDCISEIVSASEVSIRTTPSSLQAKLTPLIALKKLLGKEKSATILLPTLRKLKHNAKKLYQKINSKNKPEILETFHQYNNLCKDGCGVKCSEKDIENLLNKWDSDKKEYDEGLFSSESENSAMYAIDRSIFDHRGPVNSNQRTEHVQVLSLLLLFLSVSDLIKSMRTSAREFIRRHRDKKKDVCAQAGEKRKKKDKTISLPNFKEFLFLNNSKLDIDTCIAIAQRYCPDFVFYDKKSDLKVEKVVKEIKSDDDIALPPLNEEKEKPKKVAELEESPPSDITTLPSPVSDPSDHSHQEPIEKSGRFQMIDDKSYLSWDGPPCKKGVDDLKRFYLVKYSTEWTAIKDSTDVGIDKKFVSTEFFEYQTAMNIPRLVTEYNREFQSPRLRSNFLLDPKPSSLKWATNLWTKEEGKLAPFELQDKDLRWMKKYFTTFWITEGEKSLPWDEVQNVIFSSWSGDIHANFDDTYKYFDKFLETVDDFDKAHKRSRWIYDVAENQKSGRPERRWYKFNGYSENATTVGVLGIRAWQKKLADIYSDVDSAVSVGSFSSGVSSVQSVSGSHKFSASLPEMNVSRSNEKVEPPTGFAIKDNKSLNEVLNSFIEKTGSFKSNRVSIFGKDYRPITENYLKQLNEECGYVYTGGNPEDHPNARLAPPKAIFYSEKEKQFYHHSNHFISAFQRKYPGRFLKMPYHVKNEYGSMKHICTFISPRRLSWEKMDTWKGCMRMVSNKLECTPLDDPVRPPKMMKSPYTTLSERKGNVYELSLLLTGFLLAAGYDAYCVCGTASYHLAHFRNTDDISPDASDLEGPSTNRYKQYNLLPPFNNSWLRGTRAGKEPLRYSQLEICRVVRSQRESLREERKKWPTTEKGLIALYNKPIESKVVHRSRFDNPSIPLHSTFERKKAVKCDAKGDPSSLNLAVLYDELVQELLRRNLLEQVEEHQGKSGRSYINEPIVPLVSSYTALKTKRLREERELKRQREKNETLTKSEVEEYLEWLYGPNGPHKEYYEMCEKERKRSKRAQDKPSVDLFQFLADYDPSRDRLETLAGQKLQNFRRESIRCRRKVKKDKRLVRISDQNNLNKLKIRRYQEKMIKQNRLLEEPVPYNFPEEELTAVEKTTQRDMVMKKARKYKMRYSPLIAKLLKEYGEQCKNKMMFESVTEKLGFSSKGGEDISKKSSRRTGDLRDAMEPNRERKKMVQRLREKRLVEKRAYIPSRLHCWVLVHSGPRDVKESFFIDIATGCRYPVTDRNFLKISCVWNHENYYIPRYVKTYHTETREFRLMDLSCWFHLLPLEPVSAAVERKKKPWWWEARGHPHIYQHLRIPAYWGRRLRITPLDWDKKFANSNKKTFNYKKTTVEAYDPVGRPTDGLEKRVTRFFDLWKSVMQDVSAKFAMRKDHLIWRYVDINTGFVEERFEEGRPDHLRIFRYLAFLKPALYTPKELQFYGKWRKDKLDSIVITKRYLLAEYRPGRQDHLKRIKVTYGRKKSNRRFIVLDENSSHVERVRARFRRITPDFEMWKETLPHLFAEIPMKLDINLIHKYSEYWFWDDVLKTEVKWRSNHVPLDLERWMTSKELAGNPLLNREPLIYGVSHPLEDTPRELRMRKEMYAQSEGEDRTFLMKMARELEQIVADLLLVREYEKIKDVLRTSDDLKKANFRSEKALNSMRKYFEVEREILARDYEKATSTPNIWDLWKSDETTMTGKLLNHFIREQFWLYFVLGGWSDLNKLFKKIIKERKENKKFTGYTDLLSTLLDAFNQGFRLTKTTFPLPVRREVDFWSVQVKEPISYGIQKVQLIVSSLSDFQASDQEGETLEKDGTSRRKAQQLKSLKDKPITEQEQSKFNFNLNQVGKQHFSNKRDNNCNAMSSKNSFKLNYANNTKIGKNFKCISSGKEVYKTVLKNDAQNVISPADTSKQRRSRNKARKFQNKPLSESSGRFNSVRKYDAKTLGQPTECPEINCKRKHFGHGVNKVERKSKENVIHQLTYDGLKFQDKSKDFIYKNHPKLIKNVDENFFVGTSEESEQLIIANSKLRNKTNHVQKNTPRNQDVKLSKSTSKRSSFTDKDGPAAKYDDLKKDESLRMSHKYRPAKAFVNVEDGKYNYLKRLLIHISKILSPDQILEYYKSEGKSLKVVWNENFIDLFNIFIDNLTAKRNEDYKEETLMELVENQHPIRETCPLSQDDLRKLKKLKPSERISMEDLKEIIKMCEKSRNKEALESVDKYRPSEFWGKKESPAIQEKELTTDALRKNKRKLIPVKNVNFTFENTGEGNEEDDIVDYYQLFLCRYRAASSSPQSLQAFTDELETNPSIQMITNYLDSSKRDTSSNYFIELRKGHYLQNKKKKDRQSDSLITLYERTKRPSEKKIVNVGYQVMKNTKTLSKLNSPNLKVRKFIDVNVMEVINLFYKPSELEFIMEKDHKTVKLQPIIKPKIVKLLDSETLSALKSLFPLDYSTLKLYEEKMNGDEFLDFTKIQNTEQGITSNNLTLQDSMKSCPHCINIYYKANKDRIAMLKTIQFLRDERLAVTMIRTVDGPLPTSLLETHFKAIQMYSDYVSYLQNVGSVYNSYTNKMSCHECWEYRYFLDVLNYKILSDYFDVSTTHRKLLERRQVLESGESQDPIPFYPRTRPSVARISLANFLDDREPFSEESSGEVEVSVPERAEYPIIQTSDPIQLELYRDIREKKSSKKIFEPAQGKKGYTEITRTY